jgi:flagellar basal-body rod protein FlgC
MTLSSSFEIASGALSAQSDRLKVYTNNIANTSTPFYVRKIPVLIENPNTSFEDIIASLHQGVIHAGVSYGASGIMMAGIMQDPTPGKRFYEPGHPQADADGYITLSNVNPMTDMSDAISTSRLYEANLAVVGIVKNLANKAMEIGRGN